MDFLYSEAVIRSASFFGIFAFFAIWEMMAPRRVLRASKKIRWMNNLSIIMTDQLMVRLLFPVLAVSMAYHSQEHGWGLLNNIEMPFFLDVLAGIIMLDFIIYLQHVMFHAIPAFWRFHMMHHADLDIDITTGLRFHPFEIILSMIIKLAAVAVVGPAPITVVAFEILLNGTAMFNHSNTRIPLKIDKILRFIIVTPDMHRVHHSVIIKETNSNFGFNLSWWDWLMGTYRGHPVKGHDDMTIGLAQFRDAGKLTFFKLLLLPFNGDPGRQPINRH